MSGVDAAVDLGDAEDLLDHVRQRAFLAQVNGLATEACGLLQPVGQDGRTAGVTAGAWLKYRALTRAWHIK